MTHAIMLGQAQYLRAWCGLTLQEADADQYVATSAAVVDCTACWRAIERSHAQAGRLLSERARAAE